ncbi:MAG TPA: Asp-tRNA(Asn)/Glu-tRNA(Gln) amidotransferase subunit GatB [Phycisphaerales bacterium]|nr:Asp-tRNA(Asn)/Glu-tRNA(Gln) amidotransferase subunit GatB [Phycisphaerales bacterium]
MAEIKHVDLIVGLEIHVELSTRTKMFSRAPNVAHAANFDAPPNTLIDPVVLGLPGALPVMNLAAVETSMMVGMALGCSISPLSRWDRKSYFYPDLPKNYQISQYQLPLCFDGSVELPPITADGRIDYEALTTEAAKDLPGKRIGIIRAHLEEDAGKLLHEAPGGFALDPPGSIADYNRAGTPLLEIVTQPDFTSADEVVVFCRLLRNICRFVGASAGILQRGHIRFEPNINTRLTLSDGRTVKTPIVEIKNLNSFKAVKGAIEFERREQPRRWQADGLELRPGAKTTRGWDDARAETLLQREKEEAHDYRYFPDPDLPPVMVDETWRERVRTGLPELPLARARRYMLEFGLSAKEAAAITDEWEVCSFYDQTVEAAVALGVQRERAGRLAANFILQSGAKRANELTTAEQTILPSDLGISPGSVAQIVHLRAEDKIGANAADELFGLLCRGGEEFVESGDAASIESIARARTMLIVRDAGALEGWCDQAIAANPKVADDVRAGKLQAAGRLVGEVMKLAGGAADAKSARETLLKKLGQA